MFEFYRKLKGHLFGNTTVNVKGWLRLHNTYDEQYGLNQFYDVETNTLYLDKIQNHLISSNIRYLDKNYYEKHAQDNWNYIKEIMYERGNYEELFELRKENAALKIDLKSVENSKENYQNKIHDKNCKILSLENQMNQLRKTNHSLSIYQQLYENILKVNQNLHNQVCNYSKNDISNSEKINDLKHIIYEKEKELNKLQKDFNLFVYEYQKLKGVKEDFAETYDEYINKLRGSISFDLGGEQNIEEIKLNYEKLISELKRKNNQLTESYEKLSSEKYSKVQRLQKENNSFMISLREKNTKIDELNKKLSKKSSEILRLKNSKNNPPKKQKQELSKKEHHKITRESKEYSRYKKSVLKRDKICQCCGSSEDPEVHHPLAFNAYNHLGADTNNGIVLCKTCHVEYHHKYGYKHRNNPVTLAQFLRDYGSRQQFTFDDENIFSENITALPGGK